MRLQFSVLHLLELIAIVGMTITFNRWVIEYSEQRESRSEMMVALWGIAIGAYVAIRNFRRHGAASCGMIALLITVVLILLNGGFIAFRAPGVFLRPSPANPLPLRDLDPSELARSVFICAFTAGMLAAVPALLFAGFESLLKPIGRRQ